MASKPEDEHAYILDSFEEFEALARRALHEGKRLLFTTKYYWLPTTLNKHCK